MRNPRATRNFTTDTPGVSLARVVRRRSSGVYEYLVYQVSWKDDQGRRRRQRFQVGNADLVTPGQLQHAYRTACHFRGLYELHILTQRKNLFDVRCFAGWRHRAFYMKGQPDVDWLSM